MKNLFKPKKVKSNASGVELPDQNDLLSDDKFELDAEFFSKTEKWLVKHKKETGFDTGLKNLAKGVIEGREFLDLIPNPAGLPIRGIVKGLLQMVVLAQRIKSSNLKVAEFVTDVFEWVVYIKELLDSPGARGFTDDTLKDLRVMRDVLRGIFQWTMERVNDERWYSTKLNTETEIDEFQKRMTEAQQIFQSRQIIRVHFGIQSLVQRFKGQEDKIDEIRAGRNELAATLNKLTNSYRAQVELIAKEAEDLARDRFLEVNLNPNTVGNGYDTFAKQKKNICADGTRLKVLANIRKWIDTISEPSRGGVASDSSETTVDASLSMNFMWLTGQPGCGKSTITASVAAECQKRNILWAQFFISRGHPETTNPTKFFPSIARGFAKRSESLRRYIHDELKADTTVLDTPQKASEFFIDVVKTASRLDQTKPVVVVIDGLDETDKNELRSFATIFSKLFNELPQSPNVKILISSRTEQSIHTPFTATMTGHVKHIPLDTSDSHEDVLRYLKTHLPTVFSSQEYDFASLMGTERLEKLASQASGLFIWAVTASAVIELQLQDYGREGLSELFDSLTGSERMSSINDLYGLVLQHAHASQSKYNKSDFEVFRRLMGAILVALKPLSVQQLGHLLDLHRGSHSRDPVDIKAFVQRFRTVLVPGLDKVDGSTTLKVHKSFFEYLTGNAPEERFRIDEQAAHAEMALQCLHHLAAAYPSVQSTQFASAESELVSIQSSSLKYAQEFCAAHFPQRDGVKLRSMAFSPDGYHILSGSRNSFPSIYLWAAQSLAKSELQPVMGHEEVQYAAYSRFSESTLHKIVSVKADNTLDILDEITGLKAQTINGGPMAITCVAFSHGDIICGFIDGGIKIWNASSGILRVQTSSAECGNYPMLAVDVCYEGQWILLASEDGNLYLRDFTTCLSIGAPLQGHTAAVYSAAISPTREYFVSGSKDCLPLKTIHAYGGTGPHPVAFSPDGQQIVFGEGDQLRIANVGPHLYNMRPTQVVWTGFSPSGNLMVSYVQDGQKLFLLQLNSDMSVIRPSLDCQNAETAIKHIIFSSDEALIAAASIDGVVLLWDASTSHLLGCSTPISNITAIFFAEDTTTIVAVATDQTWLLTLSEPKNGTLIATNSSTQLPFPSLMFSDLGQTDPIIYGCGSMSNYRLEKIQWFPGTQDEGFWACIKNCLIRGGQDGKFAIIPFVLE
ncbi:hypothetical protein DXG01_004727 [Tephrocybe rancida]|nr:hypothetical protein DXG01_004727 [Tephrocybe rancida]